MSCIIWMLLKANNVWGNCLEYWQLRSQWRADGVCVYLCECFFFFTLICVCVCFLAVFPLLVWSLVVCSHHRCCQGKHVVFSHTPSSIKTTQAARMNWTSSSTEESSSSQSYWTPWVKHTSAPHSVCRAHLETHLTGGANWNINRVGQWLVSGSLIDVLSPFTPLWERLFIKAEITSLSSTCFVFVMIKRAAFISITATHVTLRSLQITELFSVASF